MTVHTQLSEAASEQVRLFRRTPWVALGVVLMLALIGLITRDTVYAHTYMPLRLAGASGALTKTLKIETDGGTEFRYLLSGPQGTVGTQYFTLFNSGSHPVRVLGIVGADQGLHESVGWLPEAAPGARTPAREVPARPFPVVVPPHGVVIVTHSEMQPACGGGGGNEASGIGLRWSALGVQHVFDVSEEIGGEVLPIMTCPPPALVRDFTH